MRERERERERVTNSPSFPRRHKILFGIIVAVGIIVYAAFNLWVYQSSKNGKGLSPATLWQSVTSSSSGFGLLKGDSLLKQGVTFTDSDTRATTPTPRLTGPGPFACSPEGDCNVYSNDARTQYCTKTFADSRCLDQCGTKETQCAK